MDRKWTFVAIGALFWAFGAMAIDWLDPVLFDGGAMQALFLLLNFALAGVSLPLFARLTGRTRHDMLVPTAIMAMPALLMDGLAVSFVPGLYGDTDAELCAAGGLLLFAFWSFFFFALLWHRPFATAVAAR